MSCKSLYLWDCGSGWQSEKLRCVIPTIIFASCDATIFIHVLNFVQDRIYIFQSVEKLSTMKNFLCKHIQKPNIYNTYNDKQDF